jgi:hypothetical protein
MKLNKLYKAIGEAKEAPGLAKKTLMENAFKEHGVVGINVVNAQEKVYKPSLAADFRKTESPSGASMWGVPNGNGGYNVVPNLNRGFEAQAYKSGGISELYGSNYNGGSIKPDEISIAKPASIKFNGDKGQITSTGTMSLRNGGSEFREAGADLAEVQRAEIPLKERNEAKITEPVAREAPNPAPASTVSAPEEVATTQPSRGGNSQNHPVKKKRVHAKDVREQQQAQTRAGQQEKAEAKAAANETKEQRQARAQADFERKSEEQWNKQQQEREDYDKRNERKIDPADEVKLHSDNIDRQLEKVQAGIDESQAETKRIEKEIEESHAEKPADQSPPDIGLRTSGEAPKADASFTYDEEFGAKLDEMANDKSRNRAERYASKSASRSYREYTDQYADLAKDGTPDPEKLSALNKKYGVSGDASEMQDSFLKKASNPGVMDYVGGYDVVPVATSSVVLGGAVSSVFGNKGQRSNADLYGDPFAGQ